MFTYNKIPLDCSGMSVKRFLWPPISLIITVNETPLQISQGSPSSPSWPHRLTLLLIVHFVCVCVCNALLPWMRPDHDFRAMSPNKTHSWRVWGWSTVGSILTWHYHILGINLYSSSIKVSCIWQSNKPYRRECCNHKIGRKQVSVEKESIWSGLYICFLLFVVLVVAAFLSFFFWLLFFVLFSTKVG